MLSHSPGPPDSLQIAKLRPHRLLLTQPSMLQQLTVKWCTPPEACDAHGYLWSTASAQKSLMSWSEWTTVLESCTSTLFLLFHCDHLKYVNSDYITRFSGMTPENHTKAVLPLTSIRQSLNSLINADTILIGHGLENDLKALRMIHTQCVDTAILFPHRAGAPYRRALKDL